VGARSGIAILWRGAAGLPCLRRRPDTRMIEHYCCNIIAGYVLRHPTFLYSTLPHFHPIVFNVLNYLNKFVSDRA